MKRRSLFVGCALFLSLATTIAASIGLGGCEASRFGVCRTNTDCESPDDAKPGAIKHGVCYNLRCVECRYDGDCSDGKICNNIGECKSLGMSEPDAGATTSSGGETKAE